MQSFPQNIKQYQQYDFPRWGIANNASRSLIGVGGGSQSNGS